MFQQKGYRQTLKKLILTHKNLYKTRKVIEYKMLCQMGGSLTIQRQRPKKNLVGLFGKYCCVAGCISAFYDKNREKINISLFSIPKMEDLRKK